MHFVANKKPIFKGRSDFFRRWPGPEKMEVFLQKCREKLFCGKKNHVFAPSSSPKRKEGREMGTGYGG